MVYKETKLLINIKMQASKENTSIKRILANRYTIISELGSGLSSKVFKVLDEKTGETKVAKIYEETLHRYS